MDYSAWTFQHSPGMPVNPAQVNPDSWSFEFPPQNGVHYLVHAVSGRIAAGAISVWVQVARTGQVMEVEPCGSENVARMRLYFQRRGDDLSGAGAYEFYRWWSVDTLPMNDIPSLVQFKVIMDANQWSSVYGKRGDGAPSEWAAAASDVQAIGMTFGGCFAGHGVYVSGGTANFIAANFGLVQ